MRPHPERDPCLHRCCCCDPCLYLWIAGPWAHPWTSEESKMIKQGKHSYTLSIYFYYTPHTTTQLQHTQLTPTHTKHRNTQHTTGAPISNFPGRSMNCSLAVPEMEIVLCSVQLPSRIYVTLAFWEIRLYVVASSHQVTVRAEPY